MKLLPSLHTLQVFEAVTEYDSFSKAAQSLNVSQGAISQHIRSLEERVGFKVFFREGRGVKLTPSGRNLLNSVQLNLGQIQKTIEVERRKQHKNELIVSIYPGFGVRWLFPRLDAFRKQYPDIITTFNIINPRENIEAHYSDCKFEYSQSEQNKLFTESIFPVCSPEFARRNSLRTGMKTSQQIKEMLKLPVVFDRGPSHLDANWQLWSEKLGVIPPVDYKHFDSHANLTLQLAEQGQGIAMGRTCLVIDALKEGKLIPLYPPVVKNPFTYKLVRVIADSDNPTYVLFHQWLHDISKEISDFEVNLSKLGK
ncbi:LysR family transcriptional regulator [Grimontia sp. NTOU-MAR1]|uniref:LysR family transcriptional regulator n=1 Tax=Grimontia sp. NTOU-MAR1 TaxID=3111011 RepID=UPI002DBA8088|nr:LysR family transcriptional regulator [Grimontia sp. NTOU-MAR1]WRV99104.1 LysR family transcriptional regulator [Grimontia sp. NTOU-MAR1]